MGRRGFELLKIILLAGAIVMNLGASKIVSDALTAAEWIAKAMTSSGYQLDFSLESLKEVDRFFDEQAPNGTPRPGGLLARDLGSRLFAVGAYVGEVVRRHGGGEWQGDDSDPRAEINVSVQLTKKGRMFWPVQRVMKRFKNGKEDGIYVYGVVLLEE